MTINRLASRVRWGIDVSYNDADQSRVYVYVGQRFLAILP